MRHRPTLPPLPNAEEPTTWEATISVLGPSPGDADGATIEEVRAMMIVQQLDPGKVEQLDNGNWLIELVEEHEDRLRAEYSLDFIIGRMEVHVDYISKGSGEGVKP